MPDAGGEEWRFSSDMDEFYTVSGGGSFGATFFAPKSCELHFDIRANPKRPEYETIDFITANPSSPPIGLIYHSLDRVRDLPAEGLVFEYACHVTRATGAMYSCEQEKGKREGTPESEAAQKRLNKITLDPKRLDPDSDLPLRTTAIVRLMPSDRIQVPAPTSLLQMRGTRWVEAPSASTLERLYPQAALRLGLTARVSVSCQIQKDHSLICVDATSEPREGREDFIQAAYDSLSLYRAADTMADGTPAAGRWIGMAVRFETDASADVPAQPPKSD
jgi:hypothetical protein